MTSFFSRPTVPRWGIYAHSQLPNLFSVVAVKDHQMHCHTGMGLALQVSAVIQNCQAAWPQWARRQRAKPQTMPAAWVMPDTELSSFDLACSPAWGPQDTEAECQLEASARMQLSAEQVAFNYAVHRLPGGAMQARVWACHLTVLTSQAAQLQDLGLQLQVTTSRKEASGMNMFLGVTRQSLQDLHKRIEGQVAQCFVQGSVQSSAQDLSQDLPQGSQQEAIPC